MFNAIIFGLVCVAGLYLLKRTFRKPDEPSDEPLKAQPVQLPKVQTPYYPKVETQRKPVPVKLRFSVFRRDKFRCVYCGRGPKNVELRVDFSEAILLMANGFGLEPDHFIAVARGGRNLLNNLVTSCEFCNGGKGDVLLTGFDFEYFVGSK